MKRLAREERGRAVCPRLGTRWRSIKRNWDLYLLILPVVVYFIIFKYYPMYGAQIAFKDFFANRGILGSPWVGFKHFERFFNSFYFGRLIKNTLGIGLYDLLVGFPIPIILALAINEVTNDRFRRFTQTVVYAPRFLSTVVLVGIVQQFLSPTNGIVNQVIQSFGGQPISFMIEPRWFKSIYVWSGVWQRMGWDSIIYLAALTGVDPNLHDAAKVDGATRLQRIRHINLPTIFPTIVTLLILNAGRVLSVGFEKVYLMQNTLNMEASDVISTYVYRTGLMGAQYSYSAAIGLFNSVVNFVMLVMVNRIARRISETSLW